jgi:hypothetical protein
MDIWIKITILQLDFDITPELIQLGEYHYHGDSKNPPMSIAVHRAALQHTVLIWANISQVFQIQ